LHNLGLTRSVRRANHALHTPDTFVRTQIPGMTKAAAIIHASPALGAAFTQYTAEMEAGGTLGVSDFQRFVYVLEGQVEVPEGRIEIEPGASYHALAKDDYAYLPEGAAHRVIAAEPARLAVIEKEYLALDGVAAPEPIFSSETKVPGQPLMGDPDLIVRGLLPDTMAFDFAVNTMTYQPGAALSMVEVHVMEHGLLMLEGGGIYRLDEEWYPVTAGDFIWMGPYCPQWFGAIGKAAAKYLIYKDWNRHPLG
jgi:(S)-ureidoglycine aminohydrolase